jgi:uncharacterized protein (TIGR02300 family)
VTKPELGLKRACSSCGRKFYDLLKDPIVCPTCETVFVPPPPAPVRPGRAADRRIPPTTPVPKPEVPEAESADVSVEKLEGAGFIVPDEQDEDEDVDGAIAGEIKKDEET